MADSEKEDILSEALKDFETFNDAWSDNFDTYRSDTDFVLLENQWPEEAKELRKGRPMLTINKLKAHGRQVINDARQNKQAPKVHPVDSAADVETAEIFNGIIRNIEANSKADAAYDTAGECAVWGGFGYLRVTLDYAYDDSFDMDIGIKRIVNPLSVLGDPYSTEADSCDWNKSFITDWLTNEQFEAEYGNVAKVDWRSDLSWKEAPEWHDNDGVMVAEYWTRAKVDKPIVLLSDGMVISAADLKANEDLQAVIGAGLVQVEGERAAKSYEVTQRIMSGVEVLKERKWPGIYIPIVPFWGEEFYIDGKRYLRSLIHSAIDAQRMYNYYRSNGAELVGLAPRAPWIGPEGIFKGANWKHANTKNLPYLEFDLKVFEKTNFPPTRQPLDTGGAMGSIQEALSASDDIKATLGMYDASLGAKSNETSGKAIMARQREGDVATFHFVDNRARAVGHTGRILLDLIPKVYNKRRIIRVLGEDGKQATVTLNEPVPVMDENGQQQVDQNTGQPMTRVYDLTAGKYDLTVSTGPSFTSQREEAANGMIELMRAWPESAPVVAPRLAKNLDWPEADDIGTDLEKLNPANQQLPPEVQQQMDEAAQTIEEQGKKIQQMEMDQSVDMAKLEQQQRADEAKVRSQAMIEHIKIKANEDIEMAKIASEERIAIAKARIQAQASVAAAAARPQPQPNGAAQ